MIDSSTITKFCILTGSALKGYCTLFLPYIVIKHKTSLIKSWQLLLWCRLSGYVPDVNTRAESDLSENDFSNIIRSSVLTSMHQVIYCLVIESEKAWSLSQEMPGHWVRKYLVIVSGHAWTSCKDMPGHWIRKRLVIECYNVFSFIHPTRSAGVKLVARDKKSIEGQKCHNMFPYCNIATIWK